MSAVLRAWTRLSPLPAGHWLFARLVCRRAPYFSTIRPRIEDLRPGRCEVRLPLRRAVTNHLGTVHAIAMCNLAELAAGLMTDATIPATHRWIPRAMSVEYLRLAQSDLRGIAELMPVPAFAEAADVPVTVNVADLGGETVFSAVITMRVSPRRSS